MAAVSRPGRRSAAARGRRAASRLYMAIHTAPNTMETPARKKTSIPVCKGGKPSWAGALAGNDQ